MRSEEGLLEIGKGLDRLTRKIRKFEKLMNDPKWGKTNFDILINHGVQGGLLEQLAKMKRAIRLETSEEQRLLNRITSLEERVATWEVVA